MSGAVVGATRAVRALAGGATACRALTTARGRARVLARPGGAAFLTAAGEIVWLGPARPPLHPRAVLVLAVPDVAIGAELDVDVSGLAPWRPPDVALDGNAVDRLRVTWRELAVDLGAFGVPAGFGTLLVGAPLVFPLDGTADDARRLREACVGDDAAAATPSALALLGLGGGLTPSGDDFVGALLFARRLLGGVGLADAHGWRRVADAVVQAAPARTHPISAALLGDLVGGCGHAPLHDLVSALASGQTSSARAAAASLVRLGHSSGWDLLAGLSTGLALPG